LIQNCIFGDCFKKPSTKKAKLTKKAVIPLGQTKMIFTESFGVFGKKPYLSKALANCRPREEFLMMWKRAFLYVEIYLLLKQQANYSGKFPISCISSR